MVRKITLVLAILIAALMVSGLAWAQDEAEGDSDDTFDFDTIYGLVSTDRAEVRSGPDFAYPTVGQLPLNASVVVTGRAGDFRGSWDGRQWIQIAWGEGRAWVYARLLRTSVSFSNLAVTGILLPRDNNGRVPDVFDLSTYICDGWQGEFSRQGDFVAGDETLTFTWPAMTGATLYSLIIITPETEFRIAFDTIDNTESVSLGQLPGRGGTYIWRVVPYWTSGESTTSRSSWQQICPLRTGGTFDKPLTGSTVPDHY